MRSVDTAAAEPVRAAAGKTSHCGKPPVNMPFGGHCDVVHPDDGGNWQLRLQVQFMFPK